MAARGQKSSSSEAIWRRRIAPADLHAWGILGMRLLILPVVVCLVASWTTATSERSVAHAVAQAERPRQSGAQVAPAATPVTAIAAIAAEAKSVSGNTVAPITTVRHAVLVPTGEHAPQLKPSIAPSISADESPPEADDATRPLSIGEVCGALAAAARNYELPVTFFIRLIWQESRFNPSAVSPVGAQGVAQFMPKTAAAYGLSDPFDPAQALPTSARYLDELRKQFGNLGLAAAAYNAGPGRLREWLEKRASLPKETRNYVQKITGRSADNWVAEDSANLESAMPQRAPCGHLSPEQDEFGIAASSERQIVTEDVPAVLQRARAALQEPPPKPPEAETRTASAEPAPARKRPRNLLSRRELSAQRNKTAGKRRPAASRPGKTASEKAASAKKLSGKDFRTAPSAKRVRIAMDARSK